MDANTSPEAPAVSKGKIFLTIVAGLIALGMTAGCETAAPQAASRALANATPTSILIPQPIAAPTVRAGGPTVASKSFNSGQHPVRRNVKLEHSNPGHQFEALPLPTDMPTAPPPGKGFTKVVTLLIEPKVTIGGNEVTNFDTPLTVTVDFTAQDAAAVGRGGDGKPKLRIGSAYKQGNAWKWQILPTTVTCTNKECTEGTLTAQLTTLHPGDPLFEGD